MHGTRNSCLMTLERNIIIAIRILIILACSCSSGESVGYELLITEGSYGMRLLDGSSDDLFHHCPLVPLACQQQRKE